MNQRQIEITLGEVKPDSYLLVNLKQTGYYRVQYDEPNWMLIANELSQGNFSLIPPNRQSRRTPTLSMNPNSLSSAEQSGDVD